MSSYLSNILTSTTSRYNSLRRTLLDNEADGDTEDDTHVSRVLRAYYTEKGRPFPPWLPPDPNDRRATTPQPVYGAQQGGYFPGKNPSYTSQPSSTAGAGAVGGRAGLGDLWDTPGQKIAPQQPQSLRAGRRPLANQTSNMLAPPSVAQARPLPSQRAGSYQSIQSQASVEVPMAPGAGGGTAQDRLKARLWGARGGTPSPQPSPSPSQADLNAYDQYDGSGGSGRRYGRF